MLNLNPDAIPSGAKFLITDVCRAEACRDKLQELNTAVAVSASSTELKEDFLSQFQVHIMLACHHLAFFHAQCAHIMLCMKVE